VLLLKEQGQEEDRGARGNPRFISQSVTPGLLLLLLQGLPDLSAFAGWKRFAREREEKRVTSNVSTSNLIA